MPTSTILKAAFSQEFGQLPEILVVHRCDGLHREVAKRPRPARPWLYHADVLRRPHKLSHRLAAESRSSLDNRFSEDAPVGRVAVNRGKRVPPEVLRERALLAELGFAFAVFPIDQFGELAGEMRIILRGLVGEDAEAPLRDRASDYVAAALESANPDAAMDIESVEDRARRALKRFLGKELGRKPMAWATATRIEGTKDR